jgi:endonuclease III
MRLRKHYGPPDPPEVTDPWRQVLWENVVYLTSDNRRRAAFRRLQKSVGTLPQQILDASDEALRQVTSHGIMAEHQGNKLRRCATIALEAFDGEPNKVLRWPLAKAKSALQRFPGIGEPGAEKILLFARAARFLGLESNGVRVLVRLGVVAESANYSTTYRRLREATQPGERTKYSWLIVAHQLLRRHGQELCRRNEPLCHQCPLRKHCHYHLSGDEAAPDA